MDGLSAFLICVGIVVVGADIVLCILLAIQLPNYVVNQGYFPKNTNMTYNEWHHYCPCLLETWSSKDDPKPSKLVDYMNRMEHKYPYNLTDPNKKKRVTKKSNVTLCIPPPPPPPADAAPPETPSTEVPPETPTSETPPPEVESETPPPEVESKTPPPEVESETPLWLLEQKMAILKPSILPLDALLAAPPVARWGSVQGRATIVTKKAIVTPPDELPTAPPVAPWGSVQGRAMIVTKKAIVSSFTLPPDALPAPPPVAAWETVQGRAMIVTKKAIVSPSTLLPTVEPWRLVEGRPMYDLLPQQCSDPKKWYHEFGPGVYVLIPDLSPKYFMAGLLDLKTLIVGIATFQHIDLHYQRKYPEFESVWITPTVVNNIKIYNPTRTTIIGHLVEFSKEQPHIKMGLLIFDIVITIPNMRPNFYQIIDNPINSHVLHTITTPLFIEYVGTQWVATFQNCSLSRRPLYILCRHRFDRESYGPSIIIANHCVTPYQIVGVAMPIEQLDHRTEFLCTMPLYKYDFSKCPKLNCKCPESSKKHKNSV